MAVTITDPPNDGAFPDPGSNNWTATTTIDNADAVDGVLIDYNTNLMYPSPGPSCTGGPDANGLYWWQVPFQPDANIQAGHLLEIYCYDAEIDGDGASVEDTASLAGSLPFLEREHRRPKMSRTGAPSITITSAELSGTTTVDVTVQLTPQTKGGIFLLCANLTGDIHKHTRRIYVYGLKPSEDKVRNHTFQDVHANQWTHIYAIAVTYRNQGTQDVKRIM